MQSSYLSENVGNIKTTAGTLIKMSAEPQSDEPEDEVAMIVDVEVDSKITNPMESLSVTKGMNEAEEKCVLETVETLRDATLPSCDVPERIIIVVDKADDDEEDKLPFEMTNGKKYSAFEMVKRAVTMFVHTKATINDKHQFALMFLNENCAQWALDFQKSPAAIVNALNVKPCSSKEFLTLDPIFDAIKNKSTLFSNRLDDQCIPPPYIVRVLFTFTRSRCLPILDNTKLKHILYSPYFYFDVLMSHGAPSEDNQCDQYFKYLTSIDAKGNSYKYSVGRSGKELHEAAAKLLAHPLQRPKQSEASYTCPKTEENVN